MPGFRDVLKLQHDASLSREARRLDSLSPGERAAEADAAQAARMPTSRAWGDVNVVPNYFNQAGNVVDRAQRDRQAKDEAAIAARRRTT